MLSNSDEHNPAPRGIYCDLNTAYKYLDLFTYLVWREPH